MTLAEYNPQALARISGAIYAINIVSGAVAAVWMAQHRTEEANLANLVAAGSYAIVSVLLYFLMKPAGAALSLAAALISLAGCLLSVGPVFGLWHPPINPLVFFGCYCVLLGILVVRSTFLPKFLGILLALGAIGWLSFALPSAGRLVPFNMLPGVIAETIFTLWLLVAGVNSERWQARASS